MTDRRLELAQRRGELRARCARQRDDLAENFWPLERALVGVDKLVAGGRWVRDHPKPVAAFAIGLLLARPRRAWRWAKRGFLLWRGWRALRRKLD
ncbi:MAG TPA: YqjK-like family protein [Rhodocyclaceae bacterium]|nr:YqjK-like family protein [Betaproteobacteria bacterium]HMV00501.1 YqjK-like family protein [Rhodocyclaceae bacterium]HNE41942.1 YqjK-like family protein [Rhodocyclaceae bacterium]HNL20952.1 YqjK-like family protein [Rhodocyclaceae bacterium]